jgi:acetylornithine deacetylase/succinyl-diaminopimelate desuccinylase-like protein
LKIEELDRKARELIKPGSSLVEWHCEYLRKMVAIDSRSFGVNEFIGDRKVPSDMTEILSLAEEYLLKIGFDFVKINKKPDGNSLPNPILMAELFSGKNKPTLLLYAHLDKQPYMDDEKFDKWGGTPPTQLRWNEDKTRAYGRGAADDLAGVTAIGMAVDALLKVSGFGSESTSKEEKDNLPCNIKVIYETEEEAGSKTLIEQITQNREFFESSDCVLITDVINPDQGIPGLTTCLRGLVQVNISFKAETGSEVKIDAQTALYKLLATLIHDDHSLAIEEITAADIPLTGKEREGFARIPTSVDFLRQTGGLLQGTNLTVASDRQSIIEAQLRKSYVNVRPGNRVSGSVIFGSAAARVKIKLPDDLNGDELLSLLQIKIDELNRFRLKILIKSSLSGKNTVIDFFVQSSTKNPHSGVNGGPFPVAELQLAKIIDSLIGEDGNLTLDNIEKSKSYSIPIIEVQSLRADNDESYRLFDSNDAKAIIEIRLAAGNNEEKAAEVLRKYLLAHAPKGFEITILTDKGAPPWMTGIDRPAFPLILEALEAGYGEKPCLYGCGGTIPFVPKLTDALGPIPPLCLGAYDPDSKMHEPGESMSMEDWLGCVRSMIYFASRSANIFPKS